MYTVTSIALLSEFSWLTNNSSILFPNLFNGLYFWFAPLFESDSPWILWAGFTWPLDMAYFAPILPQLKHLGYSCLWCDLPTSITDNISVLLMVLLLVTHLHSISILTASSNAFLNVSDFSNSKLRWILLEQSNSHLNQQLIHLLFQVLYLSIITNNVLFKQLLFIISLYCVQFLDVYVIVTQCQDFGVYPYIHNII